MSKLVVDTIEGKTGTTVTVPTGQTLAVGANQTVGGTLAVTGNTTLSGTLGVTGATTLQNLTVSGTTSGIALGKLLQGVGAKQGTATEVQATTSWSSTGFYKSITPSATSSKILIMCNVIGYINPASNYYSFNMYRHTAAVAATGAAAGTQLFNDTRGFGSAYGNSGDRFSANTCFYIDSPSSTSEVFYNVYHKESGGSGLFDGYNMDNTIVLLEIGA